jgi:ATP-dependent RNA helicase DDX3X
MRERARAYKWAEPKQYDYDVSGLDREHSLNLPWFSKAARYEWSDEYGDVAPRLPELEKELFSDLYITTQGERMDEYSKFNVVVQGPVEIAPAREVSWFPS